MLKEVFMLVHNSCRKAKASFFSKTAEAVIAVPITTKTYTTAEDCISVALHKLLSTSGRTGITKFLCVIIFLPVKWEAIEPNLKFFNARRMKMKKEGKENIAEEFKALQN
ncbi:hypothetical protein H5410_016777 [Solanum commersonii]|uniref:Uncharacterized protein n=1 Tax=Solanum commersonii TaxID=4109 RepID=A0A9J5ZXF7_SOLCO|nr:hypothetical protein H5410_016777 [Solanum commersonii]